MADADVKKPYSDTRWITEPPATVSLCSYCKNRLPHDSTIHVPQCKSYPKGIPKDKLKMPGDENAACANGYTFIDKRNR